MNDTGPEVIGSPASHPPTAGPQRRPASVARRMSTGASRTLSSVVVATGLYRLTAEALLPTTSRLATSLAPGGAEPHSPRAWPYRARPDTVSTKRARPPPREPPSPASGLRGFAWSSGCGRGPGRRWPRSGSCGSLAAGRSSTTPRSCTTSRGGSWRGRALSRPLRHELPRRVRGAPPAPRHPRTRGPRVPRVRPRHPRRSSAPASGARCASPGRGAAWPRRRCSRSTTWRAVRGSPDSATSCSASSSRGARRASSPRPTRPRAARTRLARRRGPRAGSGHRGSSPTRSCWSRLWRAGCGGRAGARRGAARSAAVGAGAGAARRWRCSPGSAGPAASEHSRTSRCGYLVPLYSRLGRNDLLHEIAVRDYGAAVLAGLAAWAALGVAALARGRRWRELGVLGDGPGLRRGALLGAGTGMGVPLLPARALRGGARRGRARRGGGGRPPRAQCRCWCSRWR